MSGNGKRKQVEDLSSLSKEVLIDRLRIAEDKLRKHSADAKRESKRKKKSKAERKRKGNRPFDFSKCKQRTIALKVRSRNSIFITNVFVTLI